MAELSFKEWVEQKSDEANSERARRRGEWGRAYGKLRAQIEGWLKEDGGDRIQFVDFPVMQNEEGLGPYTLEGFNIWIGDLSVKVIPVSRNVIARIIPPEGGELPGEGLVDIVGGGVKYHLYRTVQGGVDTWYVVDERWSRPTAQRPREADTPLTRERLQEILMDLMA